MINMVLKKVEHKETEPTETVDNRTRVGDVSLITCTIKALDSYGNMLHFKRFPLPRNTRKALGLIKGWMAFWEEQYLEKNPNMELKYEVAFYNVPKEVLEFSVGKWTATVKTMLFGKLPPLGLRLIMRHLKRNYSNCTVYVNGVEVKA